MRILHFCPSQSYSGLEQYAFELACHQKNQKCDVTFAVFPGSDLEQHCKRVGLKTWGFDSTRPLEVMNFNALHPNFFKDFDVIHLHSTQEVQRFFYFRWLQRTQKKPKIILQIHLWINHHKKNPYHHMTYGVLDEVWCSSTPAKKALVHYLPVKPEKIKIINYGRDIQKIEKSFYTKAIAQEKLGIPKNATVIGTVSRIEKSKGIKELVEAFAEISHSHKDLHLVIIGGSSPNNDAAEKYFLNLRSTKPERVYFMGVMLESYKYLKVFDLYVLPSYEECFSLSLLDAQLAELPVVGTNSGGTPEIVCKEKTGWLVEPRSTKSLKEGLKLALLQKEQWESFGKSAGARVRAEFNQDEIFKKILEEYAK